MTGPALFLLLQLASAQQPPGCRDVELTALVRAQEQLARGDRAAAERAIEIGGERCGMRSIATLALRGWTEARALAAGGGALELQGPVRRTLDELAPFASDPTWSLEAQFAETVIRAAIAAAQDERPEMELLLTHARDLSERLLLRDRRALWPQSFNLVAGDLWFEVDRYLDAAAAYERAVRADPSASALTGLARTLARLGRIGEACATYHRVRDAADSLRAAAAQDMATCR